jgi:hypothetical protein
MRRGQEHTEQRAPSRCTRIGRKECAREAAARTTFIRRLVRAESLSSVSITCAASSLDST